MSHVKVFISSLIGGYEPHRAAVAEAIESLGHQVVRAEDFPAGAGTPQQACLAAVRDADLVVLVLGERYGFRQQSGLSATHEEYREARERKPVLVFVESGVKREPTQQEFLDEVEVWSTGHFRAAFSSLAELRSAVVRAVHDYQLATAAGPVDETEMLARARALLPRGQAVTAGPVLALAVASGPHQQVLRPVELEHSDLATDIQREATFGQHTVLDSRDGTNVTVRSNALVLEQRSASVVVDQAGSSCIVQQARRDSDRHRTGIAALIEEEITASLARATRFAGWVLDRMDPLHRVTDVVPVVQITGAGYMPWRTRAEHAANPTTAAIHGNTNAVTVTLTPARRHRQALSHDADRIAADLTALLRRELHP